MTKQWRKQSIIRKQRTKDKLLLKTVDEENIIDWDYWSPPPPKTKMTMTVEVVYVGRAKPKLYYLEDDE